MQFIVYLLVYPFILMISLLPFRLLYILSDIIFVIMYYVIGYRKKVVRDNIALVFPNYSLKERKEIERKSYQHLCDMFLEMLKTMTISKSEIEKRFVFKNLDTYLDLEKKGKSIALLCAHYASYEWVISMNAKVNLEGFAIYKKINNKYFDRLVRKIRSRFKATLIHSRESIAIIDANFKKNKMGIYGFASDQSPQIRNHVHWSEFMGIEVPVHTGAETLSKKYDMNVLYLKVKKIKRGFYQAEFEVLSEDAKNVPNYNITETFLRRVEQQIIEAPEFYLWTHRRWKHKGKKPQL
jgi:KDO2-lipid IV(A) lauroyltransferase